ncbi:hypothetical protein M426DRAFT_164236 [Hypoxylon sp. CI-4A]|nr:hypothetical protein M426DRAFT_164236 [Hypoxylon sp. CI-4A]
MYSTCHHLHVDRVQLCNKLKMFLEWCWIVLISVSLDGGYSVLNFPFLFSLHSPRISKIGSKILHVGYSVIDTEVLPYIHLKAN